MFHVGSLVFLVEQVRNVHANVPVRYGSSAPRKKTIYRSSRSFQHAHRCQKKHLNKNSDPTQVPLAPSKCKSIVTSLGH